MTQVNSDSYRNPLRYQGQDYAYVPLYYRQRDPTTTDIRPKEQTGYYILGSQWVNTANGDLWFLASFTTVASALQANWELLTSTSLNPILKLTPDSGTSPVTPNDAGNVNITSSDGTIVVNGSAADTINLTLVTHPSFSTSVTTTIPNVTGDGTAYTIAYDTIQFDTLGNVSAGTFTAPTTGKYQFNWSVNLSGLTNLDTNLILELSISTASSILKQRVISIFNDPSTMISAGSLITSGCGLVAMNATDIAQVSVTVSGSTKTVSVAGAPIGGAACYFSGYLVL